MAIYRRQHPATAEIDYTEAELSFMQAMDDYKRDNKRPFPSSREVLDVIIGLGYRLVAAPEAVKARKHNVQPKFKERDPPHRQMKNAGGGKEVSGVPKEDS